MKEEGGRGMCTTKWTEHGSVKRNGRERSLSHSFGTPTLRLLSRPLYKQTKGQRGAALVQEKEGFMLPSPPPLTPLFFLPPNIYRRPVNIVGNGIDRRRKKVSIDR